MQFKIVLVLLFCILALVSCRSIDINMDSNSAENVREDRSADFEGSGVALEPIRPAIVNGVWNFLDGTNQ